MGGLAVDFPPTGIEVAAAWRCGVVLPNARVILLHNQVLYHGVCTPLVVCRALQRENAEEEIRLKILQTLPLLLASASYVVSPMFVSDTASNLRVGNGRGGRDSTAGGECVLPTP